MWYFSEVFDKDISSSLRHLVSYNILLVSENYGFRKGMSSENTSLKITNGVFLCSNLNMLYAFSG